MVTVNGHSVKIEIECITYTKLHNLTLIKPILLAKKHTLFSWIQSRNVVYGMSMNSC
jgi:hypothetical protein